MVTPGTDEATAETLRRFAALVRASQHNLVSQRALGELEDRHVPECVAFASLLPKGAGRVLDIGSGGGFPGMVVAICRPELDVHLLDATAKKAGFLRSSAHELGIDVTVHTGRAEELARRPELAGGFDVVTARAVAPLERLIGWAAPYLRHGGVLCAIKGERWSAELEAARSVIERAGVAVVATPDDVPDPIGDGAVDTRPGIAPRVVMLTRIR